MRMQALLLVLLLPGFTCGAACRSIEEDEYCLIPMGGVLPCVPQRVLGIGGTAGMVHPSTGEPRPPCFPLTC